MRLGLAAPQIVTPDLLQETDETDTPIRQTSNEETAVDDVRRIREQIDRESGGDLRKPVEETNRIAEQYRDQLGLKIVQPPPRQVRRNGTGG